LADELSDDSLAMPSFSTIRCAVVVYTIVAMFIGLTGRVAYLQTYGR
jgi:hypothetical protein